MIHVHHFRPEQVRHGSPTVVLLHGFMDAGGTWWSVSEHLCANGFEVYAPDFRGFGLSDRVPPGGYYHFADYVADLQRVLTQLDPAELLLVGHSMGGGVACYFAGALPEQVGRLVLMEGIGPPDMAPSLGPARMQTWLGQLAKPKRQSPLSSLDAAVSRLAINHPTVSRDTLERVARQLTVERDGALHWTFDSLHRTTAPKLFRDDTFRAFLARIDCPVMFMSGGTTGWHPVEEQARLKAFPQPPEQVILDGAGHMMHWTRPVEVAEAIVRFAQ